VNASIEDHNLNQNNRTDGMASNNARDLEQWGVQPEQTIKTIRENKRAKATEKRGWTNVK
jgi:hypothetical protein